jgi:hypothetical protein
MKDERRGGHDWSPLCILPWMSKSVLQIVVLENNPTKDFGRVAEDLNPARRACRKDFENSYIIALNRWISMR